MPCSRVDRSTPLYPARAWQALKTVSFIAFVHAKLPVSNRTYDSVDERTQSLRSMSWHVSLQMRAPVLPQGLNQTGQLGRALIVSKRPRLVLWIAKKNSGDAARQIAGQRNQHMRHLDRAPHPGQYKAARLFVAQLHRQSDTALLLDRGRRHPQPEHRGSAKNLLFASLYQATVAYGLCCNLYCPALHMHYGLDRLRRRSAHLRQPGYAGGQQRASQISPPRGGQHFARAGQAQGRTTMILSSKIAESKSLSPTSAARNRNFTPLPAFVAAMPEMSIT